MAPPRPLRLAYSDISISSSPFVREDALSAVCRRTDLANHDQDLGATYLRVLAAKCRRLAIGISDTVTLTALQQMAPEYDNLGRTRGIECHRRQPASYDADMATALQKVFRPQLTLAMMRRRHSLTDSFDCLRSAVCTIERRAHHVL